MFIGGYETAHSEPNVLTLDVSPDGHIIVPDAALLFNASFEQSGRDLMLINENADTLRIPDYFTTETPADLFSPEGAILTGDAVLRLAGPLAPGQYAQAEGGTGGDPIGQVETLDGTASVQRADGVVEPLQIGVKIFVNDVVQTGADSTLGVTFADGTIFTLASGSRMIIDELIYDPDGSDNAGSFSLVQGGFVFIAGQVAKTGDMDVTTPSATMGIRGTTVVVNMQVENGFLTTQVALTRDPDGGTGEIELFDLDGNLIANIIGTDSKWIVSPNPGDTREVARTAADDAADGILIADAVAAFNSALSRVEQGQTFVQLDRQGNRDTTEGAGADGDDNLEVDSIDDPESIDPQDNGPLDTGPGDDGTFDEGRLNAPEELVAPDVIVAGVEDPAVEDPISGVIDANQSAEMPIVFALRNDPNNGSATVNADGSFVYTPSANFNGTDSFGYTATDIEGNVAAGKVTVEVAPVNDAPTAIDANFAGAEDSTVLGVVRGTDIDGDRLTYSLFSGASNGSVVVVENGSFAYTPDPDYSGDDSFVVQISDPDGASALATVTLSLSETNDAPVVTTAPGENTGTVEDDGSVTMAFGALSASDSDSGATFSWSGSATGAYGQLAIESDGSWAYTLDNALADPLRDGQVATDTFVATVTDDQGATATQDIILTIAGSNDGPVITTAAGGNTGAVAEGDETTFATGTLSATDPDAIAPVVWSGSADGAYGQFAIAENGEWSYALNNTLAEPLAQGQTISENFTATVTDDQGATNTQVVAVTVTGTNDAPTVTRSATIEVTAGEPLSGAFTATDIDSDGDLTFALGAEAPANGLIEINSDGSFTYTPDAGYQGLDSFEYSVTDPEGGVATASVTVEVESESSTTENGQIVSLNINTEATPDVAAGSVRIEAATLDPTSINLAFAMDGSGSIGADGWRAEKRAVADALEILAEQFEGSDTTVNVQLISYSSTVELVGPTDLQDSDLSTTVRRLRYPGGSTNWTEALNSAEDFFDSQSVSDTNYLFFITDGDPTSGDWLTALNDLTDVDANGYAVNIEAFGIGSNYSDVLLTQIDPTPTILNSPNDLASALTETPIFNPVLTGFELTLQTDGTDYGVVANETSAELTQDGLGYDIAFAEIEGIETLIGDENRFSARVQFDLDSDPTTSEIELFSSEVFAKATTAQTLAGSDQSDLLLGSDAGDTITGGGGNDLMVAYDGDDILNGGAGANIILAGAGDDRLIVSGPDALSSLDGGGGRDILELTDGGDLNSDVLPMLDLAGIEAIDMDNGNDNALALTLTDILNLSDDADTELEALLSAALPDSATIYGNSGDTLELTNGASGGFVQSVDNPTISDGSNTLNIYQYVDGGTVLATLAVDADVAVTVQASA